MQPKPVIVLIEDDADSRKNVCLLLELEGYVVRSAPDGVTGLQLLFEVPAPDLVLCDLMLPGLDGFGVLEAVRRNPALANLPFMLLTARTDRASQRKGMNLGADDFLTKPFSAKELLSAVATRLRRRELALATSGLSPEEAQRYTLLSDRERQVLIRIGQGQSSREIGEALGISPKTEQGHRAHIMLKLALHNAQAIATFATRAGLVDRAKP